MASSSLPLHNFALPAPNWPPHLKSPRSSAPSACNTKSGEQKQQQQALHAAGRPPIRRFHRTVPVVLVPDDDVAEENLNLLLNLCKGNNANDKGVRCRSMADLKGKCKAVVVEEADDHQGNDDDDDPMEVDEVFKSLKLNDNDDGDQNPPPPPAEMTTTGSKTIPRRQVFRRRRKNSHHNKTTSASPSAAKKPDQGNNGTTTKNNNGGKEQSKKNKDQPAKKIKEFVRQRSNADQELVKEALKSNNNNNSGNQFSLTLTRKEVEDDFLLMTGVRLPRKPMRRRPKQLQALLQVLFPGSDLGLVSPSLYNVD